MQGIWRLSLSPLRVLGKLYTNIEAGVGEEGDLINLHFGFVGPANLSVP